MKALIPDGFEIKRVTLNEKGFDYVTFRLTGWLDGVPIRRQFKSHEEAVREKNRLDVQAANAEGEIQAVNTRLTSPMFRSHQPPPIEFAFSDFAPARTLLRLLP